MLERESPVPLYHQLKELLVARIRSGDWKPGDLIPGEIELQSTYALSRTTVRQALRELELDGMLTRYRGRGTFVAGPKLTHDGLDAAEGLNSATIAQGLRPGWKVMGAAWVRVTREIAERLQVAEGDAAFELRRLRVVNDEPIALHVAHVPRTFADAIDHTAILDGPSLDYLRKHTAMQGASSERLLDAVPATAEESAYLDVEPGAPMLRIRRLVLTRTGRTLEHCRMVYRGDRFQYHLRTAASAPDRDQE